MAEWLKAAVC